MTKDDSRDGDADLKADLHGYLQQTRAAVTWKLTGLSEYDVGVRWRRPAPTFLDLSST